MRNTSTGKLMPLMAIIVSLLANPAVFADSFKTLSRLIDASSLESVEIHAGIAEMDIEFYEGEQIEVEIELEAERRWFSLSRGSVDGINLEENASADNVYLGIADQKVRQRWQLRIPTKLALSVEVGVGDVELRDLSNSLEMDVGIGSVRIDVANVEFGMIQSSVGVGDSSIEGFGQQEVHNERSFVSADSYYRGDGELEIRIEVGVGEVLVRRR